MNDSKAPRGVLALSVAAVVSTSALLVPAPATALTVEYTAWDAGTDVTLTGTETRDAYANNRAWTYCSDAVNQAIRDSVSFPDRARSACPSALGACVAEALRAGRAIGAVRLYDDGSHRCLVR
jgi:hypothetical protein